MEAKFHSLPPQKRFRLLENQKESESALPAKKRIYCRDPVCFSESLAPKTTKDAVFLPVTKRVSAIRPDFSPEEFSFVVAESETPKILKNTFCLPAKKRVLAIQPDFSADKCSLVVAESETPKTRKTTYCLPAKKRVWAIGPDVSPVKGLITFPESETPETISTTISLPTKKRVWACRTDFSPVKSFIVLSESDTSEIPPTTISLPAKKRLWVSRTDCSPVKTSVVLSESETSEIPPTTICLPAKKRVWAIKPDFSPVKSTHSCLSFDLNVDYNPSPKKKPENETQPEEQIQSENEKEEEDDEGDDGILCAVCESTDGDPSDPIVFCDGCDLMVHASCYGNPLVKGIPDGDWFCAQCSVSTKQTPSSSSDVKCCLCPVNGGAMKPTTDGKWAHIVCAVLVPEVFFVDPEGRDGINCSNVPKRRWKQTCYVCKQRKGCAVECSEPKCPLSFHVSCGLKEDLCIELKEGKYSGGVVAGFCKKHTELWKKQQQTGKFKIVAREDNRS